MCIAFFELAWEGSVACVLAVHGLSVIKGVKNLVGVMNYPDYATSKCPLCDQMLLSWIRHLWLNTLLLNTQKVKAPGALFDHHGPLFLQSCLMLFN